MPSSLETSLQGAQTTFSLRANWKATGGKLPTRMGDLSLMPGATTSWPYDPENPLGRVSSPVGGEESLPCLQSQQPAQLGSTG